MGSLLCSSLPVSASTYEERIAGQQAMPVDTNTITDWPQGPTVTAEAAILIEAETGAILYSKNIHKQSQRQSTLIRDAISSRTDNTMRLMSMTR